jgi:anthranilate phosphoribosyltransferase
MLNLIIEQLMHRIDLNRDQIALTVNSLLDPDIPSEQKAVLLALLKAKGESIEETIGFIEIFRKCMKLVSVNIPILDIVGTGGDGLKTINLSTGAALLAASCGIFVAKHGNRAVSSHCGSADVLEMLNIPIKLSKKLLVKSIKDHKFGFCFAPLYNPIFQQLKDIRTSLGIPTILNLLGPFLNPTRAQHYVLGVSSKSLLSKFSEILMHLNVKKSVVVHCQGMDEISTLGITEVAEINEQRIRYYTIDPKEFNLPYCKLSSLQGDSPFENRRMLMEAFQGLQGPVADNLALNAGMGLYVYGKCNSLAEGFNLAKANLRNAAVMELIKNLSLEVTHD